MEDYFVILIIAALIQLITLIVFFVMASNVAKIKDELKREFSFDDYIEKFEEEKHIGNKEKAREWLLRLDYNLLKEIKKMETSQFTEYYKEECIKTFTRQKEKVADLLKE